MVDTLLTLELDFTKVQKQKIIYLWRTSNGHQFWRSFKHCWELFKSCSLLLTIRTPYCYPSLGLLAVSLNSEDDTSAFERNKSFRYVSIKLKL